MSANFAVVDLFAGPGGLAEGFSNVLDGSGSRRFNIVLSIEKDRSAHSTLLLRSFLRQFGGEYPASYYRFLNDDVPEPDWSKLHPSEWRKACSEALNIELGARGTEKAIDARLDSLREGNRGQVILIGGPPCQAYSLVGRARNHGNKSYVPREDDRHFLYREYIRILARLRPAIFIMENVKGILSSSVDGEAIFERVLDDLARPSRDGEGYTLVALAPDRQEVQLFAAPPRSSDFVVRAEDFGIPQARHRVFVVGLRTDIARGANLSRIPSLLRREAIPRTVRHVIGGIPALRSGLSDVADDADRWRATMLETMGLVADASEALGIEESAKLAKRARSYRSRLAKAGGSDQRSRHGQSGIGAECPVELRAWIADPRLTNLPNHYTRTHMTSDLARYFFASLFGEVVGRSPTSSEFPEELAPEHVNWRSGKFADRFRVQLWDRPSSTITSHISKDGHYFIHPDPLQCRSLTVREAARLQTFPDNYFFKGNRTQQYVQVGNAVPPFLARRIGEVVLSILTGSTVAQKTSTESGKVRVRRVA